MIVTHVELMYLAGSDSRLAHPGDDVRGMGVVDATGLRLGEVDDVVIDSRQRRARLLSVVSGGVLGLPTSHALLPVEIISKVDDRVHVDCTITDVHAVLGRVAGRPPQGSGLRPDDGEPSSFETVYDGYGVPAFWMADRADEDVYFHRR